MHRYLLYNGEIHEATDKFLSPGQVGLLNGWGVFSTLRVQEGVLFAWERHYARMKKDAELMHVPFPADPDAMRADLLRLVAANRAWNATLRVVVVRNHGGLFELPGIERDHDIIAFTKELTAWSQGVRLALKAHARHGDSPFAGVKILSWSMNLTFLEEAQSRGFDEVVLLDNRGSVSECTSANIFIAEGAHVWTPPLSSGCLPGVTRAILLEEIHLPGLMIGEREITLEQLYAADVVFITSSTRDLIAVTQVEEKALTEKGDVRRRLNDAFAGYLKSYVSLTQSAGSTQYQRA